MTTPFKPVDLHVLRALSTGPKRLRKLVAVTKDEESEVRDSLRRLQEMDLVSTTPTRKLAITDKGRGQIPYLSGI